MSACLTAAPTCLSLCLCLCMCVYETEMNGLEVVNPVLVEALSISLSFCLVTHLILWPCLADMQCRLLKLRADFRPASTSQREIIGWPPRAGFDRDRKFSIRVTVCACVSVCGLCGCPLILCELKISLMQQPSFKSHMRRSSSICVYACTCLSRPWTRPSQSHICRDLTPFCSLCFTIGQFQEH